MQTKFHQEKLKKGQSVGYGATYTADEDSVITNYDFGYGDGFLRICSNNYTNPDGKKLVGRISMDNSSFLSCDDEILIFDDASKVAESAKTISYEVLTSLKPELRREIL
jgi:alanine racemase